MEKRQNIFDQESFFQGYLRLRKNPANYNVLQEQPAIRSLLPPLENLRVLDLGCGFGESCKFFLSEGATKVVGVDSAEKMLAIARENNSDPGIRYLHAAIEELETLDETFDLVFSSLAFHYIEDFAALLRRIHALLADTGILLFSQEHPLTTAPKKGPEWTYDEEGEYSYYHLADYLHRGPRFTEWLSESVTKYHRPFFVIINDLIASGFRITKMLEPLCDTTIQKLVPSMKKDIHKPNFLVVRACKHTS